MNICYVATSERLSPIHAGFTHIYGFCKYLAESGIHVHLLAKQPQVISTPITLKQVVIHYIDWPISPFLIGIVSFLRRFPKMIIELVRLIKKERIQLIHERFWLPSGVSCLVSKLLGIPYVLEVNAPFVEEVFRGKKIRWLFAVWRKILFKSADRIITQTLILRNIIARDVKVDKISIIRNGTDLSVFYPEIDNKMIKRRYDLSSPLVVFIGTFKRWHGVFDLIRAADDILHELPNTRFLLVGGEAPYLDKARKLVQFLELDEAFIFTGPQPFQNIPQFIATSDVAVAPFNIEEYPPLKELGFWWCPIKIFEYLAMEKPVVTTSIGELPFYVPDNIAGLLYSPGNIQELARKIVTLLKDKGLRKRLGKSGRNLVEKQFTWRHAAWILQRLYQNLIHNNFIKDTVR
jgi:starch synthase